MKRRFNRILAVILMGVMTFGIMNFLFGCLGSDTVPRYSDPWKYKKEDDGFYYAVYSKNGAKTATILGLVDEELEREELVIPEKLGGYKVTQLGVIYQQFGVGNKYYGINAKMIKLIIINFDISIHNQGITPEGIAVYFDSMSGENFTYTMIAQESQKIPKPKNPTKQNYKFAGWFLEEECLIEWDFENDIWEKNTTLYAKWLMEECVI